MAAEKLNINSQETW